MSNLLYIIDTFSLVFQVFHAIPTMTGPQGQPTNAVFGFTRDLMKILDEKRPSHLICAMDSSGPGTRHELYAEYKANRSEMPEDLRPQIPLILETVKGFGVPVIDAEGWEADDVIATLTRRAVAEGFDVRIVTSDKDARQLLGPQVQLYNCRKGDFFDEAALDAAWGICPQQVIDFQALVGDSVDNIPGVPLVGPKKAKTLLEEFGTLEEVLANAGKVRGAKLQQNLKEFADQALISRRLVTLNTELPMEVDWEACRVSRPDHSRLAELFHSLGFRRYTEEMRAASESHPDEAAADGPQDDPGEAKSERTWQMIDTEERFAAFLDSLRQQRRFCVDLETTSLNALQADIVGWALSWEAGHGYYIPVQGPPGQPALDPDVVLSALRPVLEDPEVEIVNQNIKYDLLVLRRAGVTLRGVGMDPMIGDYLLDAGARSHGLDELANKYLQHKMIPISNLIGRGKTQKKMFEVDVVSAAEYASEDADIAWQLAEKLEPLLRDAGLWDLYWDLERPLITVLADMEAAGVRVDVEELGRQSAEITKQLETNVAEIHAAAGREFNIGSPLQLRKIMFEELGLPVIKRTKTGPSTSQDVLEKLADQHPLPAAMIKHRHLSKLKSTYLDSLPQMINPETGKIHTSFNQVVAATGRLSSTEPNLQNIPIRTEEGRQVRRAFIPSQPGWKLVCADYSQVELRMLAHFSQDPALLHAFQEGIDIHTAVAAQVYDVSTEEVTSDMRRVAKAVNFGVIYGQSPYGLADAIKISQDEAEVFIVNYFQKYAGVAGYLQQVLLDCMDRGYAETILGRRRAVTGIRPNAGIQRNLAERTAINSVIQGSAADLIKQAMLNVQARLQAPEATATMLLQIHDELIFEAPADDVDDLIPMIQHEMSAALELRVPLVVDVKVGDNWLDAAPV